MLKEALEFIFGKANDSANPVIRIRKTGPLTRIVNIRGDDREETIEPPATRRDAHTLQAVADLVDRFSGQKPTAYVSETGARVVLDDDVRHEFVVMDFTLSPQFTRFLELANGERQAALVRTLRTTLDGCVDNELFLSVVRQMEFDTHRGSSGNVNHAAESFGKTVERQVRANAGELPGTVRVRLPLFTVPHDVPTEITLECAVTVDLSSETVAIEATGDSLTREKARVLTEIVSRLDALLPEDVLVVFGDCSIDKVDG